MIFFPAVVITLLAYRESQTAPLDNTPAFLLFMTWLLTIVSFVVITMKKKISEQENTIEKKEIDDTTVMLLYILSFFIPLAGFIVGAIYASKDEEHYKHVGKNCLIFSVMNIILGFIMIVAILGSM
jgi:Ca2+/Na+ antiporter